MANPAFYKYIKSILVVICLMIITNSFAQIKAGSNPKSIFPSSLLELESQSKGLLLTRLSDTVFIKPAGWNDCIL